MGSLGSVLGPLGWSWGPFGAIVGSIGTLLEPPSGHVGTILDDLGNILDDFTQEISGLCSLTMAAQYADSCRRSGGKLFYIWLASEPHFRRLRLLLASRL